jgi:acyl carrier protein
MSSPQTPGRPVPAVNTASSAQDPTQLAELIGELQALIVSSLNLEDVPGDTNADTPLYGEGLGLDSIDILEIALVVSKRYGLQLRADDGNNAEIFRSLGSLAGYIAVHRTK